MHAGTKQLDKILQDRDRGINDDDSLAVAIMPIDLLDTADEAKPKLPRRFSHQMGSDLSQDAYAWQDLRPSCSKMEDCHTEIHDKELKKRRADLSPILPESDSVDSTPVPLIVRGKVRKHLVNETSGRVFLVSPPDDQQPFLDPGLAVRIGGPTELRSHKERLSWLQRVNLQAMAQGIHFLVWGKSGNSWRLIWPAGYISHRISFLANECTRLVPSPATGQPIRHAQPGYSAKFGFA